MVTLIFQEWSDSPTRICEYETIDEAKDVIKRKRLSQYEYLIIDGKLKVIEGDLEIFEK